MCTGTCRACFSETHRRQNIIFYARENLAQAMEDLGVAFFGYVAQSLDEEKAGCASCVTKRKNDMRNHGMRNHVQKTICVTTCKKRYA